MGLIKPPQFRYKPDRVRISLRLSINSTNQLIRNLKMEDANDKVEPITKKAFNRGNYIDPNVALTSYFDVVATLTPAAPDAKRMLILVTLTLEILTTISSLLEFDFWDTLLFDSEMPSHILPDANTRKTRRKLIDIHIARLGREATTIADVTDALDFASDLVDGLNVEFSNGVMPADRPVPDDQRFYCAALIPALSQLFTGIWAPRQEDPLRARNIPAGRRPWRG